MFAKVQSIFDYFSKRQKSKIFSEEFLSRRDDLNEHGDEDTFIIPNQRRELCGTAAP